MSGTGRHLRVADLLPDALVVVVAGWTVVFHVALVAGWSRTPTTVLVAVLAAPTLWFLVRTRRADDADDAGDDPDDADDAGDVPDGSTGGGDRRVVVAAVLVAGAISVVTTLWRPSGTAFVVVWAAVLLLAAAAVWAIRSDRRPAPPRVTDLPDWAIWVVAGLAALGALALVRQDLDDVELVNRSLYIEQHAGPFPTRDTVVADEVFASDRPENPATSIEALIGVVAVVVPVSATTVAHLWLGPLVVALGVLALHRLLRTMRAPAPVLVTGAAWLWMQFDGEVLRSLGNHHLPRAWQGKAILLIVVIPVLWHHGLRWLRDGDRRSLAIAVACGVAAVGLSRTGTFLPLLVLVTLVAAAWCTGRASRTPALLAVAAYPLGAGLFGLVAERAPTAPRSLLALQPIVQLPESDPAMTWYSVLGRGVGFAVAFFCVLTAWLWVRDRTAAAVLALAPAAVALFASTPTAGDRIDELTDADSLLWRSVWAIPVAGAIGLGLVVAPRILPRASVAAVAVPAVLVIAFAADGTWIGSADNRDASIVWPPAWKVDPDDLEAAERIIDLSEPGSLVAAPLDISGTLATVTLEVRAVAPRDDSLKGRIVVPELLADQRRSLTFSLTTGTLDAIATELARTALTELDVATVCTRPTIPSDNDLLLLLVELGFEPVEIDEHCTYWLRSS